MVWRGGIPTLLTCLCCLACGGREAGSNPTLADATPETTSFDATEAPDVSADDGAPASAAARLTFVQAGSGLAEQALCVVAFDAAASIKGSWGPYGNPIADASTIGFAYGDAFELPEMNVDGRSAFDDDDVVVFAVAAMSPGDSCVGMLATALPEKSLRLPVGTIHREEAWLAALGCSTGPDPKGPLPGPSCSGPLSWVLKKLDTQKPASFAGEGGSQVGVQVLRLGVEPVSFYLQAANDSGLLGAPVQVAANLHYGELSPHVVGVRFDASSVVAFFEEPENPGCDFCGPANAFAIDGIVASYSGSDAAWQGNRLVVVLNEPPFGPIDLASGSPRGAP